MNTKDRIYRVRGKPVRLQEVTDVAAVRVDQAGHKALSSAALAAITPRDALPQVRALEHAGWAFIPKSHDADGATVYLKTRGGVALGTNRLTVRVAGQQSDADAEKLLDRKGFRVVHRLKFASNLFVVSVPNGDNAVDAAERLSLSSEIDFAEPELIEIIPSR